MKVKLDRDEFFWYFIYRQEALYGIEIELSEAERAWIDDTFAEMEKVQEFLWDLAHN